MAGGEGEALLEVEERRPNVIYFEGCPGCAVDRRKAENQGIPYKHFFHVWIIVLVSCLPISLLFPFLYFMIRDLHVAKKVEDIGFYAGFLGASYMLGRALTSTAWGMVADRIGRKPIIVLGIISALVFNTLFGLSVHYWMALATRFLLGSFNGLLGTIRAYAVEICRPEHQAIGLTLVSTGWAIGLILGPAVGGYLAQPAEKYPELFPVNSLFGRFPYFLPCLCISVFSLVTLISCIWLPGTRSTSNMGRVRIFLGPPPDGPLPEIHNPRNKETFHTHKLTKKDDQEADSLATHSVHSGEIFEQDKCLASYKNLFKNWPLMSSIILFCIICFDDIAYTEIFSLWAESDKKYGGLSFSSADVGQVYAVTGASILLYQTFIYPRIVKALGPIKSSRVASILSMVLLSSYPHMTRLSRPWISVIVNIASMLKCNFVVTAETSSLILQNKSVPQDQRATANGLATTLMSFGKALAPAGAGIVFSWAQSRQHAYFLPGDQMVFFFLSIIVFIELIWTFKPFVVVTE